MAKRRKVLAIVLAGGEGKRLAPLTADRAKPAVPFGGNYRLVDFALSNLVNGGMLRIVVLTQYKSHSLDRHLALTWRLSPLLGNYVTPVPAQMRLGPRWFSGSADAIYQNLNLIYDENPDYICVFGADHIYRMDPGQMLEQHIGSGHAVTVAGLRVPIEEAGAFGVLKTDGIDVVGFLEKPTDPVGLPDSPGEVVASMGNYVFTTEALVAAVTADAADDASGSDIGGDLIPSLVRDRAAGWYDFERNDVPGQTSRGYWRDVGTLDAYYDAHMDLISATPSFPLDNESWPIYSWHDPMPPAKFLGGGQALDSMVSLGVVLDGGCVRRSVLSPRVRVHPEALVEGCVLMEGVEIGAGATVRNAILDKGVHVPPGAQIGVDAAHDRERFAVSDNGVVVLGKHQAVPL